MTLTDEQLASIEELAGLFLTADEIAILLDIDIDLFIKLINDKKSLAFKHYFRGKTESKKNIRANIVKMAKHGSPQAEELVDNYITAQNIFEKKNHGR